MGKVHRLRSRAEQRRDDWLEPRQGVLFELEAEGFIDEDTRRRASVHQHQRASALFEVSAQRRFAMLDCESAERLDDWLYSGGSKRPHLASRVLRRMETRSHLRTGEVLVTRAELAAICGCSAAHVSSALTDLERAGAIERKRDGRRMRIFLSSALKLRSVDREAAAEAARPIAPQLSLVE